MGLGYVRQLRPHGRLTLRQRVVCALFALLALVAPAPALAQLETDSETADAIAAILAPGSMTVLQDMDFGTIAQPAIAGTVTMVPTPTATCNPSAGILHTDECQPAHFALMGRKNWLVRIRNQSGNSITLTGPGGATMTLTNLTINVSDMVLNPGGPNPPGTFGRYQITSDSGFANFRIGGRLNIGANQGAGTYTGTFDIQVLFN